jgi:hypothetical protein
MKTIRPRPTITTKMAPLRDYRVPSEEETLGFVLVSPKTGPFDLLAEGSLANLKLKPELHQICRFGPLKQHIAKHRANKTNILWVSY